MKFNENSKLGKALGLRHDSITYDLCNFGHVVLAFSLPTSKEATCFLSLIVGIEPINSMNKCLLTATI